MNNYVEVGPLQNMGSETAELVTQALGLRI
jgi:hypothetical protein